jgi:hypothetical protein
VSGSGVGVGGAAGQSTGGGGKERRRPHVALTVNSLPQRIFSLVLSSLANQCKNESITLSRLYIGKFIGPPSCSHSSNKACAAVMMSFGDNVHTDYDTAIDSLEL